MKKLSLVLFIIFFTQQALADINLDPLLNKVTLQLESSQWVTTQTALVSVLVNASVSGQGIETIQNSVMQKLNQLSSAGEWHIISFDRQLDKSGLESIQILAEARLAQSALANLRDKAKSISKPGETFTVDNVQFTPSDEELKQANIVLRNNLYQQAKTEIESLNKTYPEQKYYLHQIDFLMAPPIAPMMMNMAAKAAVAPKLSVGNKIQLQATVVLASMPDTVTQKLTH